MVVTNADMGGRNWKGFGYCEPVPWKTRHARKKKAHGETPLLFVTLAFRGLVQRGRPHIGQGVI